MPEHENGNGEVTCDEILAEITKLQENMEKLIDQLGGDNDQIILEILQSLAGTLSLLARLLRDCLRAENDDDD